MYKNKLIKIFHHYRDLKISLIISSFASRSFLLACSTHSITTCPLVFPVPTVLGTMLDSLYNILFNFQNDVKYWEVLIGFMSGVLKTK